METPQVSGAEEEENVPHVLRRCKTLWPLNLKVTVRLGLEGLLFNRYYLIGTIIVG